MARRVDSDSQEKLWEEIGASRMQKEIDIADNGHVNAAPDGAHLRIVCISDTHCRLGELAPSIPDGDVLIHAGDITSYGDEPSLLQFNKQLGELPHKYKLVIAGNHELGFDPREDQSQRAEQYKGKGTPDGFRLLTNCTYLNDSHVTIEGIHFYGSSWHPLYGYPFYRPRNELAEKWKKIPDNVDVLITHSPPLGYRDLYPPSERWGCHSLLTKVEQLGPRLHVFGHVHACYGASTNGVTTFVNAAMEKASKDGLNKPLVFHIPLLV